MAERAPPAHMTALASAEPTKCWILSCVIVRRRHSQFKSALPVRTVEHGGGGDGRRRRRQAAAVAVATAVSWQQVGGAHRELPESRKRPARQAVLEHARAVLFISPAPPSAPARVASPMVLHNACWTSLQCAVSINADNREFRLRGTIGGTDEEKKTQSASCFFCCNFSLLSSKAHINY